MGETLGGSRCRESGVLGVMGLQVPPHPSPPNKESVSLRYWYFAFNCPQLVSVVVPGPHPSIGKVPVSFPLY